MSFLDHLLELRRRILISAATMFIMMVVSVCFFKPIWDFLLAPVKTLNQNFMHDEELRQAAIKAGADPNHVVKMVSNDPLAVTIALCKICFWLGLVLSAPMLLYQLWGFVAPGLRANEKRAIQPVLFGGIFCFLLGAVLCYYLVFPISINFLVWLDLYLGLVPLYTADRFVNLLIMFMVIFGAMFEIPVVAAVFARLGLLKPEWLTKYWRITVFGCFVAGAIISPSNDLISYLIFSGCLLFLWGASVALAYLLYPRAKNNRA